MSPTAGGYDALNTDAWEKRPRVERDVEDGRRPPGLYSLRSRPQGRELQPRKLINSDCGNAALGKPCQERPGMCSVCRMVHVYARITGGGA